jgi:hypothetical protein
MGVVWLLSRRSASFGFSEGKICYSEAYAELPATSGPDKYPHFALPFLGFALGIRGADG